MKSTLVYLSLGGNEGDVLSRLHKALDILTVQKELAHLKSSHFYRTAPHEMNSARWFVNAVCSFETSLSVNDLFTLTQFIEIQLGKVSKPKNMNRPIDIDVLFYGDEIYHDNNLEIPHPRWKERLFVLVPLADLTSEIVVCRSMRRERYVIQELIHPLFSESIQEIYLLEKNPDLKYYISQAR